MIKKMLGNRDGNTNFNCELQAITTAGSALPLNRIVPVEFFIFVFERKKSKKKKQKKKKSKKKKERKDETWILW